MLKLLQTISAKWHKFNIENKLGIIGLVIAAIGLIVSVLNLVVPVLFKSNSQEQFYQVSLQTQLERNKSELNVDDIDLLIWVGAKEEFVTVRLDNKSDVSVYNVMLRVSIDNEDISDRSNDLNVIERSLLEIFKNICLPGHKVEEFPLVTKSSFIKGFKESIKGYALLGVGVDALPTQKINDSARIAVLNRLVRNSPGRVLGDEVNNSDYRIVSIPFGLYYEWNDIYGRKRSMLRGCYSYWLDS